MTNSKQFNLNGKKITIATNVAEATKANSKRIDQQSDTLYITLSFAKQLLANAKKAFADKSQISNYTDLTVAGTVDTLGHNQINVSLGEKKSFTWQHYLTAIGQISKICFSQTGKKIALYLEDEIAKFFKQDFASYVEQFTLHLLNGLYFVDNYKTDKQKLALNTLELITANQQQLKTATEAVNRGLMLADGLFLLKNLANAPANVVTPTYLADITNSFTKLSDKVTVKTLDQKQIEKLKMGAFLAVTKGSTTPPKFIVLEYTNHKNAAPIVLVGKGITFDSGGISIKGSYKMEDMKYDMTGAATVISVFKAAVMLNLKINLVVLVPTCENMPAGCATKPGDIVENMAGKTIEIINTDAEGRLILCDALSYAAKFYKPKYVIDLATLTGAMSIALGRVAAGLFANDDTLAQELLEVSADCHERIWRMPIFPEFNASLKNSIADLRNVTTPDVGAGSAVAAAFLANFTEDYRWAHLDIANTAYKSGDFNGSFGSRNGATGHSYYLLVSFLVKQQ